MTREALIKHWDVIQAFKEGKQIQYNDSVPQIWQDTTDPQFKLAVEYRVKPEATKRLPTIEEVEKWFLENRVFMDKKNGYYARISCFDKTDQIQTIKTGTQGWISVEKFCEWYNNIDGSELYITE